MSGTRKLFGGAITVELPTNLVDVSTIREVPDTQEVFVAPSSEASYVVEILERVEPADPKDAARFHFDALAADNDATSSSISSIDVSDPPLPPEDEIPLTTENDDTIKSDTDSHTQLDQENITEAASPLSTKSAPEELSTPSPIFLHGSQTVRKFNRTSPDEVRILLALFRIEHKPVDLVFTANLPVATEAGDGMTPGQLSEAEGAFITAARSLRVVDFSLFV